MKRSAKDKKKAKASPGQKRRNVRPLTQPAKDMALRAFAELIAMRQYDEISVADILGKAQISRSAFYEHFRGKQDLLTRSIASPFKVLADGVLSRAQPALVPLLEHFWSNRHFARGVLIGSVRPHAARVLALQIESRLKRCETEFNVRYQLPRRLLAWQLTESMLGLIVAWLTGEARCSAIEMAEGLSRSTHSLIEAQRY